MSVIEVILLTLKALEVAEDDANDEFEDDTVVVTIDVLLSDSTLSYTDLCLVLI